MKVRPEITVAVENMPGRLAHLTECLGERKVNISAISVVETTDMALVRMVVDKPALALQMLVDCCPTTITVCEVLEVALPNKAGALNTMVAKLAKKRVNIQYVYGSTAGKGRGVIIMKVDNVKAAQKALK